MPSIPSSTIFETLLSSIITNFEAITGMSSTNVLVGTYSDVELVQSMPTWLYAIEILMLSSGGVEYIDQRNIRANFNFEFHGHAYTSSEDRTSGTDMINLEHFASVMRTQMYAFHDVDPDTVTTGFIQVNSDFALRLQYREHSKNINTAILTMGFMVDFADTTS